MQAGESGSALEMMEEKVSMSLRFSLSLSSTHALERTKARKREWLSPLSSRSQEQLTGRQGGREAVARVKRVAKESKSGEREKNEERESSE